MITLQIEEWASSSLPRALEMDSMLTTHPLIADVINRPEVESIVDSITYTKVQSYFDLMQRY